VGTRHDPVPFLQVAGNVVASAGSRRSLLTSGFADCSPADDPGYRGADDR